LTLSRFAVPTSHNSHVMLIDANLILGLSTMTSILAVPTLWCQFPPYLLFCINGSLYNVHARKTLSSCKHLCQV